MKRHVTRLGKIGLEVLQLIPPRDSIEKGQGYDDMIGYTASSLSQRLM